MDKALCQWLRADILYPYSQRTRIYSSTCSLPTVTLCVISVSSFHWNTTPEPPKIA